MATTLEDLARQYADQLRDLKNNHESLLDSIAAEINGLTYTATNKPLSAADLERMVELIRARMLATGGEVFILRDSSNSAHISLLSMLSARLRTTGKR